jgi:hypothetical protein
MLQLIKRCAEILCFTWTFLLYSSSRISIEPKFNDKAADQPENQVTTPIPKKIASATTKPTVAQVQRLEIQLSTPVIVKT